MEGVGYIRVSSVRGRSGDSFLSPTDQRREIERLAQREGITITTWLEELGASGGDASRPKWNQALKAIEQGKAQAILVWNISRFSRSLTDALKALERIEKAGGALYSASGDVGDDTPSGRFTRNVFLSLAEMERERARDNFRSAQVSAIGRGIHMQIPTGYRRDPKTRKLEIDPKMAPVVKAIFEMRARGATWGDCAKYLIEYGNRPTANRESVRVMIRNRAYLGVAYHGDIEQKNAHPAIVSQRLFDKANAVKGRRPSKDGTISSKTLLQGLVFCGSCGHKMALGGYSHKGVTTPQYICKYFACTAHASTKASALDDEVVRRIFSFIEETNRGYQPKTDEAALSVAERYLKDVEYDREKLVKNTELRRLLSFEEYNEQLAALNQAVEEARAAVAEAEDPQPGTDPQVFREAWSEWTMESRREWLNRYLKRVTVRRSNHKKTPIAQRMFVETQERDALDPCHRIWLFEDGPRWVDMSALSEPV